jgi:hypothetical protein
LHYANDSGDAGALASFEFRLADQPSVRGWLRT